MKLHIEEQLDDGRLNFKLDVTDWSSEAQRVFSGVQSIFSDILEVAYALYKDRSNSPRGTDTAYAAIEVCLDHVKELQKFDRGWLGAPDERKEAAFNDVAIACTHLVEGLGQFEADNIKNGLHSIVCASVAFGSCLRSNATSTNVITSLIWKQIATAGGKARVANDPRQGQKQFIKQCWSEWQDKPDRYKSKVEFAKDMLPKVEDPDGGKSLTNTKTIERWCREWEKESSS